MKLVKYDKFLETMLNIGLLKTKGEKLVDKLEKPNPKLTLNDGEHVEIYNSDTIVNDITDGNHKFDIKSAIDKLTTNNRDDRPRYNKYFVTSDGVHKLNDFKRDRDFGSAGAGMNTRNFENLQCIYLAHKLNRPNVNLTEINIINFLDEFKFNVERIKDILELYIPETESENIKDSLNKILEDPDWVETLVEVTNDLYDFKSLGKSLFSSVYRGKYKVYHISYNEEDSPFKIINDKFLEILKKNPLPIQKEQKSKGEKVSNINIAKYCPADVIVYKGNVDLKNILKKIKSIDGMTYTLNALFSNRILIPISLKKVGRKITKNVIEPVKDYDIIVNNEFRRSLPEFRIKSFTIYDNILKGIGSKIEVKSIWTNGKGELINGDDRIITIDSANTSNALNVDGEVQGKHSRHGKISFLNMVYFIELISKDIKIAKPLLEKYVDLVQEEEEVLVYKIDSIISILNGKKSIVLNKLQTGSLIEGDNKKNKLISKLQSLQIILALVNIDEYGKVYSNNVINKIMRYALSIQADIFITPRYVRVI